MPLSVHKILIYKSKAIQLAAFPIDILSKEDKQRKNKDYIKIIKNHIRKSSGSNTNLDICHLLLTSSDPLISFKSSPKYKDSQKKLCFKTLDLLNKIIIVLMMKRIMKTL